MRALLMISAVIVPTIALAQTPPGQISRGDASQDGVQIHGVPQGGEAPGAPRPAVPSRGTAGRMASPDNAPRMADNLQPAPVPAVMPPTSQTGQPSSVPEQISPPGVGNNIAGPADATPFSSTPSSNMPPDAAMPNGRDGTQGGAGALVPNTSK